MQYYKGTDNTSNSMIDSNIYHVHSSDHLEHSPNSSHMSLHSDEPLFGQSSMSQSVPAAKNHRENQLQYMNYIDQPPTGHLLQTQQQSQPLPVQQHHHHHPNYRQYPPSDCKDCSDHYPNLYNTYVSTTICNNNAEQHTSTPPSPSVRSATSSPVQLANQLGIPYLTGGVGAGNASGVGGSACVINYADLSEHYRVTPSPAGGGSGGGRVLLDPYHDDPGMIYGYVSSSPYETAPPPPAHTYDHHQHAYLDDGLLNGGCGAQLYNDDDEDQIQTQVNKMSLYRHHIAMAKQNQQQPRISTTTNHHLHLSDIAAAAATGSAGGGVGVLIDTDDSKLVRWRNPNLSEVIKFLSNANHVVQANAAAYLQHLCYMDDSNKQNTRALGGIPVLVNLLNHDSIEVYRNACGALRNLSYGRQNDENKRAIKNCAGLLALINLLKRSNEMEIKELITGVIWNMSSCEDLKRNIIDEGVPTIVSFIIIPHSGWNSQGTSGSHGETCWTTVFRNASGVLRNVSSAGEYARKKLRECSGLIESLLIVIRCAIDKSNIGNKIVENIVCILRNLSYRCQEVEDPNYDKNPVPIQNRVASSVSAKSENFGCFGGSKKKKNPNHTNESNDYSTSSQAVNSIGSNSSSIGGGVGGNSVAAQYPQNQLQLNNSVSGMDLLWQPDVVHSYLALLQSCSNPETLEAAAGTIQNLAACYWQPSIEIRAAVRKEKGLPILVELLRMEVDRVVCAVATALRNLAIDQRNKELIGKYAMRDLVQKLPSGNLQHDHEISDDTIAAVLATLNEVIKKNAEFARSLFDAGGVERLLNVTRQKQKYTGRVLKFAGQVLFTMWQHQELREVYKKHGWKEQDFITKTFAARSTGPNSPNNVNSTLNRPMASQSGTRYEDRTIKRTTATNVNRDGPVYQMATEIKFQ